MNKNVIIKNKKIKRDDIVEKITITSGDNSKMSVDLVRYFKFKNDYFLIYTMNEMDEKGYLKLYLVKIMEELGNPIAYTIKNDKEWTGMQNIIKKVLKEIKTNKKRNLVDLDYSGIQEIKIVNPRFFKLDPKLVDTLASNYQFAVENLNSIDINNAPVDNNLIEGNNIEVEETTNNESNLEPIEETLMKQGAFVPIDIASENTITNENIQNVGEEKLNREDLKEIDSNENSSIQQMVPTDQLDTNSNDNNYTQVVSPTELSQNNQIDTTDNTVDYKKLYLSEKQEKETINEIMNHLLLELQEYKNKYGELEK